MAASSSNSASGTAQNTSLDLRAPKAKSTGSAFTDEENEARRQQFMTLLNHYTWTPRVISPLYAHMQKLLSENRMQDSDLPMFEKNITIS